VQVSLENYPQPGQLSHWYLWCKTREAVEWETAWIDLRRPEEIKEAGAYKGMGQADPSLRGMRLSGFVAESHRAAQPPGRRIWLGPVRFSKKAVDFEWDQRKAPFTWGQGQDLVFRYPLEVANRLDRPVSARITLRPLAARHATAEVARETVELAPGARAVVEATVRLKADVAAKMPPLYCERFLALAEAQGIDDSQVTILRSSDPVPLTVTVPIAEEKLRWPLLPRRKDLPEDVTGFNERVREQAVERAAAAQPGDLMQGTGKKPAPDGKEQRNAGFYPWGKDEQAQRFLDGLTAAAFLYDRSGKREHLDKGTALLKEAAEWFPRLQQQWAEQRVALIGHGIFSINTLRLGWATGSMRSPYVYDKHGMFNDFDLLAADMDPNDRRRIIEGFLLPAGIHMSNHTFGLGNQQDVVNYAILYAGLAARNWPLVSFGYSSDYGLLNQLRWDFDDQGLAGEGHYHTPAVRPVLYAAELLYHRGVNVYDDRLRLVLHSPAAAAIGKPFQDRIRDYLTERRLAGVAGPAQAKSDGAHLSSGVTSLRWGGVEVSMNWGMQIHRGAPDRCTLRFGVPESHALRGVGGGNYSHSSLGQSILVVDEGVQDPVPARVTGYDIEGPVQFVQAVSDRHFPGSTVTRTFALLEGVVLVIDRVASDRARTVDWCLRYAGGSQTYEDVAGAVSLPLKHRDGSFTTKPADAARGIDFGANLKSPGHFAAVTDGAWRAAKGSLLMAGQPKSEVHVFAVPAAFSASVKERKTGVPVLMVRRRGVSQTSFIAAFSPKVRAVEQLPVHRPDGSPAQATGVRITLQDGGTLEAIANYEGEGIEVRLGGLKTRQRFAASMERP
jgi:hypothetical protein